MMNSAATISKKLTSLLVLVGVFFIHSPSFAADYKFVKCTVLDSDFKKTNSSFTLVVSYEGSRPGYVITTENFNFPSYPGIDVRNPRDGYGISEVVGKRPGMEKSTDYKNSYELAGIFGTIIGTPTLDPLREFRIQSDFNDGAILPPVEDVVYWMVRDFRSKEFVQKAYGNYLYEHNLIGSMVLFTDYQNGKKTKVVTPIQCKSLSNPQMYLPNAKE